MYLDALISKYMCIYCEQWPSLTHYEAEMKPKSCHNQES